MFKASSHWKFHWLMVSLPCTGSQLILLINQKFIHSQIYETFNLDENSLSFTVIWITINSVSHKFNLPRLVFIWYTHGEIWVQKKACSRGVILSPIHQRNLNIFFPFSKVFQTEDIWHSEKLCPQGFITIIQVLILLSLFHRFSFNRWNSKWFLLLIWVDGPFHPHMGALNRALSCALAP